MRIFKQRSGVYAVAYRDPRVTSGNPWRTLSLRTKDEREAQSNLQEWLAEQNREKAKLYTLGDLWELYRPTLAGRPSEKTRLIFWKNLSPSFGRLIPASISEASVRSYSDTRKSSAVSNGTIRAELKLLRTLVNWSIKRGHISGTVHIPLPSAPPPKDLHLTRTELGRVLDKAEEPHLKLFIILAVTTAARVTALLELTWDRVDFERKRINLRTNDETTRKGRAIVPMNATAFRVLQEAKRTTNSAHVISWGGMRIHSIQRAMRSAAVAAGMPWVTPHVLRHTAAVWMAESGVPMSEISQYLGHSSTAVTERVYARYSPAYLAHAASALEIENA